MIPDDWSEFPVLRHVLDGRLGYGSGHNGWDRRDRGGHWRPLGLWHRHRHCLVGTGPASHWHLHGEFFFTKLNIISIASYYCHFMIPSFAEFLTGSLGFGGVVIWKPSRRHHPRRCPPGSRSPRSRPPRSTPPVSISVPAPAVPRRSVCVSNHPSPTPLSHIALSSR